LRQRLDSGNGRFEGQFLQVAQHTFNRLKQSFAARIDYTGLLQDWEELRGMF